MRLESNHAQGTFNQLRVALLQGLTYRLCSLYYQIEAIKSRSGLEVCFTLILFIMQSMSDGVSDGNRQTIVQRRGNRYQR